MQIIDDAKVHTSYLINLPISSLPSLTPARRVQAMTRIAPVYHVRWRSQVVRTNTRVHPTPASNVVSRGKPQEFFDTTFIVILGYQLFRTNSLTQFLLS